MLQKPLFSSLFRRTGVWPLPSLQRFSQRLVGVEGLSSLAGNMYILVLKGYNGTSYKVISDDLQLTRTAGKTCTHTHIYIKHCCNDEFLSQFAKQNPKINVQMLFKITGNPRHHVCLRNNLLLRGTTYEKT